MTGRGCGVLGYPKLDCLILNSRYWSHHRQDCWIVRRAVGSNHAPHNQIIKQSFFFTPTNNAFCVCASPASHRTGEPLYAQFAKLWNALKQISEVNCCWYWDLYNIFFIFQWVISYGINNVINKHKFSIWQDCIINLFRHLLIVTVSSHGINIVFNAHKISFLRSSQNTSFLNLNPNSSHLDRRVLASMGLPQ